MNISYNLNKSNLALFFFIIKQLIYKNLQSKKIQ